MPEGTVLRDRYRLERLLGRGGMADVYLAFDLRRQVNIAVKLLREDLAEDPEFLQRFQREAEALARLDHPYIVRFYSFERQTPLAFIIMDYVPGVTLRTRLLEAGGPLPLPEVTHIVHQIGSALQYAHNEGFIHRDIKPGNIMLRPDGTALLSDFGIARAMAAMTMTMAPLGTPAYMSPEQILGQEADPRTDVYCLGVVMYEMVTGRRPFAGDGGTGSMSTDRVRAEHLHTPAKDPRSLNPSLPTAAAQVILRALAKSPAQRWPNMTALVQAWEAALGVAPAPTQSQQVPAGLASIPGTGPRLPEPPPPVATRARSGSKLSWLLWAVAGLFTLLFVFVVVVLYRSLSAASAGDDTAAQQTLDARTQHTAVALAAEWGTATAGAAGLSVTSTSAPTPSPLPAGTTPAAKGAGADAVAATAAAEGTAQAAAEQATADAAAAAQATVEAGSAEKATVDAGSAEKATADAAAAGAAQATADAAAAADANARATAAQATADAQVAVDATAKAQAIAREATATAQAAPPPAPGLPFGFERDITWRRGDQANGDLVRSADQVHAGSYSGALGYTFPATSDNFVVFLPRPALPIGGKPTGVTVWVYGDGSGALLNFWVIDSAGEVRQYTAGQIGFQGWGMVAAPFDDAAGWPNSHIDGPDNGTLDYPVRLYAIVLDGVPDGQASKGIVYLDDIAGY